ncbi:hypothetical protein VPH35_070349 [Triticum aestivum]
MVCVHERNHKVVVRGRRKSGAAMKAAPTRRRARTAPSPTAPALRLGLTSVPSALQHRAEAELAWFHAKEAVVAGDVAAVARVPALLEEFQLQATLRSMLIYKTLHGNEPPPSHDSDHGSGDE